MKKTAALAFAFVVASAFAGPFAISGGGSGGSSGTVSSVAATGANGIVVTGSPIVDSGTLALTLPTVNTGALTATSITGTLTSVTGTLTGNITGNAATVTTNANLTGPITSTGNATALAAQTGTGSTFVVQSSPTINTPTLVAPALGTPSSGVATNLTGTAAGLTAGSVTTNANLTGPITSSGNATALTAQTGTGSVFVVQSSPTINTATLVAPALGTPSSGVMTNVTGTASNLTAGTATRVVTNANLTGPITSSGNATAVAAQTGTGSTFVMDSSPTINTPTFVAPALGTPSSGVMTNATGTAASLTAGNATKWTTGRTLAVTGDLTYTSPSFDGSGNVTAAGTLATVNSNVGSFTNASVTVNGKGLVTAASSGTAVTPGGSDTQLQYNNASAFGGAASWTTDGTVLTNTQAVSAATTLGLKLKTSATATVGAQKWSSALDFEGSGWKTTATAAAQLVNWRMELQPVQGAAAPSALLSYSYSINGSATYTPTFTLSTDGTTKVFGPSGGTFEVWSSIATKRFSVNTDVTRMDMGSLLLMGWSNAQTIGTADSGLGRSAAGMVVVNDGNNNATLRDLKLRQLYPDFTNTATIGAVTINKGAGQAIVAAAGTSVVVTNSLVTVNSQVMCTIAQNDATATLKNCVAGSGSFTITLSAAATANTSINFLVLNQ